MFRLAHLTIASILFAIVSMACVTAQEIDFLTARAPIAPVQKSVPVADDDDTRIDFLTARPNPQPFQRTPKCEVIDGKLAITVWTADDERTCIPCQNFKAAMPGLCDDFVFVRGHGKSPAPNGALPCFAWWTDQGTSRYTAQFTSADAFRQQVGLTMSAEWRKVQQTAVKK